MSFLNKVITTVFGKKSDKDLKKINPLINQINDEFIKLEELTDDQIRNMFLDIKSGLNSMIQDSKNKNSNSEEELKKIEEKYLDDNLVKVFAIVKDVARRLKGTKFKVMETDMVWDMVHYDVQLIGGIVKHQGKIAEMQTGEGKHAVFRFSPLTSTEHWSVNHQ